MLLTSWVRSLRQTLKARRRGAQRGRLGQSSALHAGHGSMRSAERLEERMLLTALVIDQQYVAARNGVVNIRNVDLDIDGDGTLETSQGEFDSIIVDNVQISGANTGINVTLSDLTFDRIAIKQAQLSDPNSAGINISLNNITLDALSIESSSVTSSIGGGINLNLVDIDLPELTIYDTTVSSGLNAGLSIDINSQTRNSVIDELDISDSTFDGVAITALGRTLNVADGEATSPIELTVVDYGLQPGTVVDVTGVSGLTTANTRAAISPIDIDLATPGIQADENRLRLDGTTATGVYLGGGTATVFTSLNSVRITENAITGTSGEDGLNLNLTTTRAPGITIENNPTIRSIDITLADSPLDGLTIRSNTNIVGDRPQIDAVHFDLTRSALTNLIIDGNTINGNGVTGGGGATFETVDGNVYGSFSNNIVRNTLGNGLEFSATATASFFAQNRGPLTYDFASLASETTLTVALSDTDTTLQVVDGRSFQAQQTIIVDDEQMVVIAVNGNSLTVVRGENGTLALKHQLGTRLRSVTSSASGDRRLISGNIFDQNDGAGFFTNLTVNTAINAQVERNTFTANQSRAIDVTVQDTAAANTLLARGGLPRLTPSTSLAFGIDSAADLLQVADGREFRALQTIAIDSERMTIVEVNGNTLTVSRMQDGTQAASHSAGAAIQSITSPVRVTDALPFANFLTPFDIAIDGEQLTVTNVDLVNDLLIVRRGVNGTPAAAHATNATVTAVRGDAMRLDIGGATLASGNTFTTNRDGAVHITLHDKSAGSFNIRNNTITQSTRSVAGLGDGIQVDLTGTDLFNEATNVLRRSFIENNRIGVTGSGTLNSNITAATTVFTLNDATSFQVGDDVQLEGELLTINAINGNTITVSRAANATTAASHTAGSLLVGQRGGNVGRGINVFFAEQSVLEDIQIVGNVIANNGDDGIRLRREDEGITRTVNPAAGQNQSVTIRGNAIVGNAIAPVPEQLGSAGAATFGAGIEIVAANGSLDSFDVDIRRNQIIANARLNFPLGPNSSNGINLRSEADAQIIADLANNTVIFNEGDGVALSTRENAATDKRDIGGIWTGNTLSNNRRNGVEILGRFGTFTLLEIGREGSDLNGSRSNLIERNAENGIDIRRGGNATIVNNEINNNGPAVSTAIGAATPANGIVGSGLHVANGSPTGQFTTGGTFDFGTRLAIKSNNIAANAGMGIDINALVSSTVATTIRNNLITENRNDGIEISGHVETAILGNFIDQNLGRGIDLMSFGIQGSQAVIQSNYEIGDGTESGRNTIVANQEEGIYYVNSSDAQDQNLLSTDLNSRRPVGETISWPAAILQIDTNTIGSNGVNSGLSGTGVVLWIGSTGADNNPTNAYVNGNGYSTGPGTIGGLVDGSDNAFNFSFGQTGFARTTTPVNSRTNARIAHNDFEGNFGDDFRIEAFISTIDPLQTAGTWDINSTPRYSVSRYISDPLSRLNLVFEDNSGNGLDVRNTVVGAGYTNDEPLFKSRTTGNNPGGPFGGGTRARDITRVPTRVARATGLILPPNSVLSGEPNRSPDALYLITSIDILDVGNGITELMVTVGPDLVGVYGGVLPFGDGATVEIINVIAVNGQPHSSNGVYQVTRVDQVGRTMVLQNSAGEGGPAYVSGGYLSVNLNQLTIGPSAFPPFQYPGMGTNTMRIAQGFDTSGADPSNQFKSGDNFFVEDGINQRNDFDIWTPNAALNGTITDVQSNGAGGLSVTAPNHGLSDRRVIFIQNVNGIPAANGRYEVEVIDRDTFDLTGLLDGTYIGGGNWRTLDESFPEANVPSFPVSDVIDITPDPRRIDSGIVTLNFSEPVTNVDVDDVFLTRDGVPVDVSSIPLQKVITPDGKETFTIDLRGVTDVDGLYALSIDAAFPEAKLIPISPDPATGPSGVVTLNFTEDVTGVDISDFVLAIDRNDSKGFVAVNLSETGANLTVNQITPKQYTIDLSTVSNPVGTYRLTLLAPRTGTRAVSIQGFEDQTGGTLAVGEEVRVFSQDHGLTTGQAVTLQSIRGFTLGPDTVLNGTYRIEVLDKNHFRLGDATLSTFQVADDVGYLAPLLVAGRWVYEPGIIDRVGRPFSVDRFGALADATDSWTRINTAPTADIVDVTPDPRVNNVDRMRVVFSEKVNYGSQAPFQISESDFVLTYAVGTARPNRVILPPGTVVPIDLDSNNFVTTVELRNLSVLTAGAGTYRLRLITSDATRITDADGSTLAFEASEEFVVVGVGPAPDIVNVFPDPRNSVAGNVTITFNEPVVGVDTANANTHFELTRDRGDGLGPKPVALVDFAGLPIALTPNTNINPTSFTLDLSSVTGDGNSNSIDGTYTLTLKIGAGILSSVDNEPLSVGAVDTWIQDSASPVSDILDIDPSPRIQHAGIVTVRFNELVTGLDRFSAATDFSLTRDLEDGNGPQSVSLAGVRVRPISPVDVNGLSVTPFDIGSTYAREYVIDLSTAGLSDIEGLYSLTLTANGAIFDLAGNLYRETADSTDDWDLVPKIDNNRVEDLVFSAVPTLGVSLDNLAISRVKNVVLQDSMDRWFRDSVAPTIVPGTVSVSPDPRSTSLGVVTVNFSEAVSGVNLSDFVLTRNGGNVSLAALTATQVTTSQYTLDLNLVTGAPGNYQFGVQGTGSLIFDVSGNPLATGLQILDSWTVDNVGPTATIAVDTPRKTSATDIKVTFTNPVDVSRVEITDFRLERDTGNGFIPVGITTGSVTFNPLDDLIDDGFDDVFIVNLGAAGLTDVEGTYRITLVATDSGIVDQADIEFGADASTIWVLDNTSPTADIVDVLDPLPSGATAGIVNILFLEPVTGVNVSDLELRRDGSLISLAGLTVIQETTRRYTIDLTSVTSDDGFYVLRLLSSDAVTPIRDIAGNQLVGAASVAAEDSWVQGDDAISPTVQIEAILTPRNTPVGVVRVTFSEDINAAAVGLSDFQLTLNGSPVPNFSTRATIQPAPGSDSLFLLDLTDVSTTQGMYRLTLNSNDVIPIMDRAGNLLASGIVAERTWQNTLIDPFAIISDVTPSPRLRPAGVVTVDFSRLVEGVDITDFRLSRSGQSVSLRGLEVVQSPQGSNQYFVDLTSVTGTDGSYKFSIVAAGSGIAEEITGNAFLSDASIEWQTATTIAVNTTADRPDVNPGDGIVADSVGLQSLRAAVMEAGRLAGDDVISVPAGMYELSTGLVGEQFAAGGDLDIFDTTGTTIIRGEGDPTLTTIDGGSLFRVFHVTAGATLILENVTIQNGRVTGSEDGGGLRNDRGTVILRNCILIDNQSLDDGGAINNDGSLTIYDSTLSRNSAVNNGGAIRNVGDLRIENSLIGGVFDATVTPIVDDRNVAGLSGGAIVNIGVGAVTLLNSTVSGNRTTGALSTGGAISNQAPTPTIASVLNTNINATDTSLLVTNGAAFPKQAVFDIRIGTEDIRVTEVIGNRFTLVRGVNGSIAAAHVVGNVVGLRSNMNIVNSTITLNSSASRGGGLFASSGSTLVGNTIIAGNTAVSSGPDVSTPVSPTAIISLGNNIIGANNGAAAAFPVGPGLLHGTSAAPVNPRIGTLTRNGGPTLTHSVLFGSPAIDAGQASLPVIASATATDQRGITRVLGQVDIGAFEFGGFFVSSTEDTVDAIPGDGIVADNFGRSTLRAAVMESNALAGPNAIKLDTATYVLDLAELDRTAPTINFVDISPDPLANQMSALESIDALVLQFSEPLNIALANIQTLVTNNIRLTRTDPTMGAVAVNVPLVGVTITRDADDITKYTLKGLQALLQADGFYEFRFLTAPVVSDFEFNNIADDLTLGRPGIAAIEQVVRGMDVFAPTAQLVPVAPVIRTSSPDTVTLNFSEPVFGLSTNNFTLDFTGGMPVATTSISLAVASIQEVSPTQYTLDLSAVSGIDDVGAYVLTFDSLPNAQVADLANNQYVGGVLTTNWTVIVDTVPAVVTISPVTPGPRIGTVGEVTISFDEDVTGIDLDNAETHFNLMVDIDGTGIQAPVAVALLNDDGTNVTLTMVNDSTYTIDLSEVTKVDGIYSFTFDPAAANTPFIQDLADIPNRTILGATITFIIGDDVSKFGPIPLVTTEDSTSFGDLDVIGVGNDSLIIIGSGADRSTIDATALLDRVFDVYANQSLQLRDVAVTGGSVLFQRDGGAIRNVDGTLTITNTDLSVNVAGGRGGAIFSNNVVTIDDSTLSSNRSDFGAGVFIDDDGTLTITQSVFSGNIATTDGGGIYNDRAGDLQITGANLTGNSSGRHGGGIYNNDTSTVAITDSTLSSNIATGDGGAVFNELAAVLTIDNSTFAGNRGTNGGAIFDQDGTVDIRNSALSANAAEENGGAVFLTSAATLLIDATTLSGNQAKSNGGAIDSDGTATLTNVRVLDNTSEGSGGAIDNSRLMTIQNAFFAGNSSAADGGAIRNAGSGRLTITTSTLTGNRSDSDDDLAGNGGAIHNSGTSTIVFTQATLSNNSAGFPQLAGRGAQGGALFQSSTGIIAGQSVGVVFTNSTVSGNEAGSGGGISSTKSFDFVNSTLSSNSARVSGGGLQNNGGTLFFSNATIFGNSAGTSGGGIRNESVQGSINLKNTIVAGDTAPVDSDISGLGLKGTGSIPRNSISLALGNNLIGNLGTVPATNFSVASGNLAGTTASPLDPLLGPLQDNGGPTQTHALLFGSPARDRGSNVAVPGTDQRGFARIFDGDGNGTATVDIGSFESGFVVNTFLDTIDVKPGDLSSADGSGNSSLRAAVMEANALDGDDTILLIPGTFKLTIAGSGEDGSASGDLDVTIDSVTIIGSGTDQTFIDAAGLDRVFDVRPGATLSLKNLTLLGGRTLLGGGVLNQGTLILENVVITDNTADFGGGIYNDLIRSTLIGALTSADTTMQVVNAAIFPTQVPFDVTIDSERVRITSIATVAGVSTFSISRGINGTTAAVHAAVANVTLVGSASLSNVTITRNEARLQGGGLFNKSTLTLTNIDMLTNNSNSQGGGLFNQGTVTIVDTTFDGNSAAATGGAIYNDAIGGGSTSEIDITSSTLSNNDAGVKGGAIYNTDLISALNSTISGNSAGSSGGGIFNTPHLDPAIAATVTANFDITNVTVVLNTTDSFGGGIVNVLGGQVSVRNTIVSGNIARKSDSDISGAFISRGANFIGDAGSSTGLVNFLLGDQVGSTTSPFDAVFAALADNGGATKTHALLEGSAAIGRGDNSGGEPIDQRGGIRPTDTTADVGAFEIQANRLSITNVTLIEGDTGSTLFNFAILLDKAAAEPITVHFATEADSAKEGSDYIQASGDVTFAPGELTKVITIEVNGDITSEATEQFFVRLSNAINATIIDDKATGTIQNDDAYVSITDVSRVEGDTGTQTLVFTVTLDAPTVYDVTVDFETANNTAIAGSDYVATSGQLTFDATAVDPANRVSQTITVTYNGDLTLEAFESFFVNLTNGIDSNLDAVPFRDAQGLGTIKNDEISVLLQDTAAVTEGDSGTAPMTFTVTLLQPVGTEVKITAATVSGSAIGGSDYVSKTQVLTFAEGVTSQNFTVSIIGDTRYEDPNLGTPAVAEPETFSIALSSPLRDGIANPAAVLDPVAGIGSIADNDPAPAQWLIRQVAGGGQIEVLKDNVVQPPLRDLTAALLVIGSPTDDVFTVDYANGDPVPVGGLTIDGGAEEGGDVLIIQNGTATNIVYRSAGAESGTIDIDTKRISYLDLEPITDLLAAQTRTVVLHDGVDHDLQIVDDTAIAGSTLLQNLSGDVTFESISFANPAISLTVNLGSGNNEASVESLDPAFAAVFTLFAGGGDDQVDASLFTRGFAFSGEAGNDILQGGSGADTISGGSGADNIFGNGGTDTLRGHDAISADDLAIDTIDGGTGNDTIDGEGGDDSLLGGDGNDSILGQAGNDFVSGGIGNDQIFGGVGNDVLNGDADADVIQGEAGLDTINGGAGGDSLFGGADDDSILGGGANDTLRGEAGNDFLGGDSGDDSLLGGDGNDSLAGGAGTNVLDGEADTDRLDVIAVGSESITLTNASFTVGDNPTTTFIAIEQFLLVGGSSDSDINAGAYSLGSVTILGGAGNDTITGSSGSDNIDGGSGRDSIFAGTGNDTVVGGTENDTIFGQDGADSLTGGDGDDSIDGGVGNDVVSGGLGNDLVSGGNNNDTVFGDGGNDQVFGNSGNDLLVGHDGNDVLEGGTGNDTQYGGAGIDTLVAGIGDDVIEGQGSSSDVLTLPDGSSLSDIYSVTYAAGFVTLARTNQTPYSARIRGTERISINALGGNDVVTFGSLVGFAEPVTLNFDLGDGNDVFDASLAQNPVVVVSVLGGFGNDTITGGAANDILKGDAGQDFIIGGLGNDLMFGGDDADNLLGGSGKDIVNGDAGNDTIKGNGGNDVLNGGAGDDILKGDAGDDVASGGDGNDRIAGDIGVDALYGDDGEDTIKGEDGNDVVIGGSGADLLSGGSGNDRLGGGLGRDYLLGDAGNDTLGGANDPDVIVGGSGNDSIEGNGGFDTLTGGSGGGNVPSDGDRLNALELFEIDNAFVVVQAILDRLVF